MSVDPTHDSEMKGWSIRLRRSLIRKQLRRIVTARVERAVRAAPGATSDRAGGVRGRSNSSHDLGEIGPGERQAERASGPGISSPAKFLSAADSSAWSSVPASFQPSLSDPSLPSDARLRVNPEDALESFHAVQDIACKLGARRGTLELLSLLSLVGPCTLYHMRKSVRVRQRALYGSIRALLDLKLVEVECMHSFPRARTKTYRLSAQGAALIEPVIEAWLPLLRERVHV